MGLKTAACAIVGLFCGAAIPSLAQSSPGRQQQIEEHLTQAREFLKSRQPDLAAREYNDVLALDPDNIDAHGNLGVLLFFEGDYAKAAPQLRSALKLQPGLTKIQALLGMCEKRIGEIARAKSDLENSFPKLEEEKLRVETGLELIEIYYETDDLDKAAGIAGMLRQLKPVDPEVLFTAHRVYSDLADETMLSLAMVAPESARMHQLVAHELARQGNTEGAIAQYRKALEIEPRLPGAHFELAEMLAISTSPAEQQQAVKEYEAALANSPTDEKSERRLGEIAFRESDMKGAFAHFSRALQLQPNDADADLGLAKTLMAMNQPDKAKPLLEEAARLDPTNATTRYHLATVYRGLGRTADARREMAEFQKLKELKARLKESYREMRLQPAKQEQPDPGVPK
ncbi:MAG: tetratricopeptide repeat protein, partial [Bryobacteraceae bacterium]